MRATGEALAQRHRAIESKFLDVSSHLDFLEKAGKRWFVLAFATLSFLPVVLWGFQSWGIWARDRRLNRSTDE